jgi:predicted permease
MTLLVLYKLLAIVATIGLGWLAMQRGWLASRGTSREEATQVLANATLYLFVPALLFRTIVRQDLAVLPWRVLAAYFVPALAYMLAVYAWHRLRSHQRRQPAGAGPATRAIAVTYGNAVQLGIPMAAALFGETGLALHIALVSLHGLVLLTVLTMLVEADLARGHAAPSRWTTLRVTVRNTLVHPVVLPVLAGLLWNFTGLGLHPVVDQALHTLGQAAVPMALALIGATLATHGVQGHLRNAWGMVAVKLLVMPAVVLLVAHQLFGLRGMPLSVLVMMAALPAGTNAVIFAGRYQTLLAEVSVAVVLATFAFVATAGLWLAVLGWVGA